MAKPSMSMLDISVLAKRLDDRARSEPLFDLSEDLRAAAAAMRAMQRSFHRSDFVYLDAAAADPGMA